MTPGPFDAEQGTSALPLTDEWKDCLDIIRGSSISDLFDNPEDENLTKEDLIIPPFLRKEQGDDS